jgi:chromosome segregation ATPase
MAKSLDAWRLLRENQERLRSLKGELEALRQSRDKQLDARLSRLSDEYCELEKQLKIKEDEKELMQIRMGELERFSRMDEEAPEEIGRLMAELSDLQRNLKALSTRADELHLKILDCGQLMEERQAFRQR